MSAAAQARRATAFAPASVANVAVGFDILGFSMPLVGDRITVERVESSSGGAGVVVDPIRGVVTDLPRDPAKNTAAVALQAMLAAIPSVRFGFRVGIDKGIPLGSGMGGSAASAVGAVVAANAVIDAPFGQERLLEFALAGETAASGSAHADNIAPCLYGGLNLALSVDPLRVVRIPVPSAIQCVLVHPHLKIETRQARSILKPTLALREHVHQSAHLAGFIAACHNDDLELLSHSMIDLIVEPQRAELIPGFYEAKRAAIAAGGALGFSISGSGPSVFAWCSTADSAERTRAAIVEAFKSQGIAADSWISLVSGGQGAGARLI